MCLPERLMDLVIIKGDRVKLSVIPAAPRQSYVVSCQIDVTGCDVMFSCHVIWLLIKDMAQTEHRLDRMSEVTKKPQLWRSHSITMKTTKWEKNRLLNFILWQVCLFSYQWWCAVLRNHCFTLLCCNFDFKHKEHKLCISGHTMGKNGAQSRNSGVIPAIPYYPLVCGVVPLSHMWEVHVASVNTETHKRNSHIQGIKWSSAMISWSVALWSHHGNCGSSTKRYRDVLTTYTQCTKTTLHCSFTLYSTLSRVQELFQEFTAISV